MNTKLQLALQALSTTEPFKAQLLSTFTFEPEVNPEPQRVFNYGPIMGKTVTYNESKIEGKDEIRLVELLDFLANGIINSDTPKN